MHIYFWKFLSPKNEIKCHQSWLEPWNRTYIIVVFIKKFFYGSLKNNIFTYWLFFIFNDSSILMIFDDEVDCLLFCFFIAYCFSVFYPPVTSPVFWWWVWISPRSAYQRYPAPVTFFCLSLSLFRTVNLKMYNISLSPHFWEFFEFNN